jgi:hypothetical protein
MKKLVQSVMLSLLGTSGGCITVPRAAPPQPWPRSQVEECTTTCHDTRDRCVLDLGDLFDCRNGYNDCLQECQTHVPRVDA